jgi:hypothetical protein
LEFQVTKPIVKTEYEEKIIEKAILLNEYCFNQKKSMNECFQLVLENRDLDENQLIEKFLNINDN